MSIEEETMKKCSVCGILKPLDEFHKHKTTKDGKRSKCKECRNEDIKDRYHNRGDKEAMKDQYHNRNGRERRGHISMYKNKLCASYLGVAVNECLIKHLYPDAVMTGYGFPGYDFECNRGKKVNAKGSTAHNRESKKSNTVFWVFGIRNNKLCDHFLCVAYDNVKSPTPLHIWMIPASEVNDNGSISISASTIHKWDEWKIDINEAQACCTEMKTPKEMLK